MHLLLLLQPPDTLEGQGLPCVPRNPRSSTGALAGLWGLGSPAGLTQLLGSQALDTHAQDTVVPVPSPTPRYGHGFLSLGESCYLVDAT